MSATFLPRFLRSSVVSVIQWFDSDYEVESIAEAEKREDKVEWVRTIPFCVLHLGCLGVLWTGASWLAVGVAFFLYVVRMFAVTGFYHRYFSHRTFTTSRFMQFIFGLWGATCVQRGALWWAYTHRHHHQHSDDEKDKHSPRQHGFLWAHIGWITSSKNFPTDYRRVKDLARYPELVFLNRFDVLIPVLFAIALYVAGNWLNAGLPGLHTSGWQLVVWGFFISTTVLFHCTAFINSLAHVFGKRRYETDDDSRNSFLLAIITLGEGWHNNHHRHMGTVRQGFYWWEIDVTYYGLKVLSWLGLIWDLRPVPVSAYDPSTHLQSSRSTASPLGGQKVASPAVHPQKPLGSLRPPVSKV